MEPDIKDEYDFGGAARGKFYRSDADLIPPTHLDRDVPAELKPRAEARGVPTRAST